MIFSGNELIKKRRFYSQSNNFGLVVNLSLDDPTGRYEMGISGDGVIKLVFESGKIMWNDLFIQTYQPLKNYLISFEITNSGINYKQNDSSVFYGLEKETGKYDYFFFSRENASMPASFDFSISGYSLPDYNIQDLGILFNSGQKEVTGLFSNIKGEDIKIFSSFAQGTQNLNYLFSDDLFSSGQNSTFKYSGNFSEFDFSQPITTSFYTNFGNKQVDFKIVNATDLDRLVLLNDVSNYEFNSENKILKTISWNNYSGGVVTNNFNTEILLSLEYVDGSGLFESSDFADSAFFNEIGYGNFIESGLLTGVSRINTGNGNVNGIYTINFDSFKWATGLVTGFFDSTGIGMTSGINYTGLGYARFTGFLVANILDGSGKFIFQDVIGVGSALGEGKSIEYNQYVNSTGFINLSGMKFGSSFFVGIESKPIVKGIDYVNETDLVFYLNNNLNHKVLSKYEHNIIKLTSIFSGTAGNDIFIRQANCEETRLLNFTPFLIGGLNIGSTGSTVYPIPSSPFTGFVSTIATGSGDYSENVFGVRRGSFSFERTFSSSWGLKTGLDPELLTSVPEGDSFISGKAILPPNSSLIIEIEHNDSFLNIETIYFNVSGENIINPIKQLIQQ